MDEIISDQRLREMAETAERSGRVLFSPFLTPAEAKSALFFGKKVGIECLDFGGYPEAERRIVGFGTDEQSRFPIKAMEITWPLQQPPQHRDLLGALLGLGLKRSLLGDILLEDDRAYVFAEEKIASFIAEQLQSAGRIRLRIALLDTLPAPAENAGEAIRATVMSLRLDSLLSVAFHLSRSKSEEMVHAGLVKKNYLPCVKGDERLQENDLISLRGYGRVRLEQIGPMTKKGRLSIEMTRYSSTIHK